MKRSTSNNAVFVTYLLSMLIIALLVLPYSASAGLTIGPNGEMYHHYEGGATIGPNGYIDNSGSGSSYGSDGYYNNNGGTTNTPDGDTYFHFGNGPNMPWEPNRFD